MSYNCFIKSRSAFLLLFGGEMTSGFWCRSTSPPCHSTGGGGGERYGCTTVLRWSRSRSYKHQTWIQSGGLIQCHMAVLFIHAWQTCRSAHTDSCTSRWNLFTDSVDQSIMSSLSLAPSLSGATYLCRCPQNTQNVVNPTWIVRAEKKRKNTFHTACAYTNTHAHKR